MKPAKLSLAIILLIVSILIIGGVAGAKQESNRAAVLKKMARNYYWGSGVNQDYSRALSLYEMAAALGDPQASIIAGGMYHTGKGTVKNPFRAFDYLEYGERSGAESPDASAALAGYYLQGRVTPLNYPKAVELYSSAAAAGSSTAQLELGFLYYNGLGIDQDFSTAHYWFEKAALGNEGMAQYNLGIMWYSGNNRSKRSSLVDAYAWMNLAASNNIRGAYGFRKHLESALTTDQLRRAQQKSTHFYEIINEYPVQDLSDR